jgi:hypothetical protein
VISIANHKIDIPDALFEHVIDCIIATAADSQHFDYGGPLHWQIKVHYIV